MQNRSRNWAIVNEVCEISSLINELIIVGKFRIPLQVSEAKNIFMNKMLTLNGIGVYIFLRCNCLVYEIPNMSF